MSRDLTELGVYTLHVPVLSLLPEALCVPGAGVTLQQTQTSHRPTQGAKPQALTRSAGTGSKAAPLTIRPSSGCRAATALRTAWPRLASQRDTF